MNILLIDDDEAVRRMIGGQLRDWGCRVDEAATGKEGLRKLTASAESEDRPNIVLLDWNMPGTDGIAVCKWIKSCRAYDRGPHLYVLFLTVNEGVEYETAALKAGADGYIVKGSRESFEVKLNVVKERILEEFDLRSTIAQLRQDPSGVLVKREIIDRLGRRADRPGRSPLGIVILDIDGFKDINDRYGHLTGDQILEALGKRLQEAVRSGNVGRYGGDEFLIGLPGCNTEITEKRARDIVERITADPFSTSAGEILISISYGTASSSNPANLDALIDVADRALYQQKSSKRKTIEFSPF